MTQVRFVYGEGHTFNKTFKVARAGKYAAAVELNIAVHRNYAQDINASFTLTHVQLQAIIDMAELEGFNARSTPPTSLPARLPPLPTQPHGPQEYRGSGKHTWEKVGLTKMIRLRVPGGWLYGEGIGNKFTGQLELVGETTFVEMPACVGYFI